MYNFMMGVRKCLPLFHTLNHGDSRILRQECRVFASPGKPFHACQLYLLSSQDWTGLSRTDGHARNTHIVGLGAGNAAQDPGAGPSTRCSLSQPYCWTLWCESRFPLVQGKEAQTQQKVFSASAPLGFSSSFFCLSCFLESLGVRKWEGNSSVDWPRGASSKAPSNSTVICEKYLAIWKGCSFFSLCAQFGLPHVSRGYL